MISEKIYNRTATEEITNYIISSLNDGVASDCYGCELHNLLFNTDYYFVYTHDAEKWIGEHFGSTFRAIDFVQVYEKENFGETHTDISDACKVANMCAYIIGEDVLYNTEIGQFSDVRLTQETIDEITDELILSNLK